VGEKEAAPPPPEPLDPGPLAELLDQLEKHLRNQEGESLDCLARVLPWLPSIASEAELEALLHEVEQFDFEAALQRLQELRKP
jgi:hypothetical protein